MASFKLIQIAFVVLCLCSMVTAQSMLARVFNAFLPGSTTDQQMSIFDPLSPKAQSMITKLSPDLAAEMQRITIAQIKQDIPAYKLALKQCLYVSNIKQCIQTLKAVDPEITKLLSIIKQLVKNQKPKVVNYLQNLKPMLNSTLLQNIVQTMINILQPPSASRRRRRKRGAITITFSNSVTSLKQAPLTLQQLISMIKNLLKQILAALTQPPPSPTLSILQQIINAISSVSSIAKTFFSNPAIMKLLGTVAPP